MVEVVHSDDVAGGEVNTGALGLSVVCVCVALGLDKTVGVRVPLRVVPLRGGRVWGGGCSLEPGDSTERLQMLVW